MDGTGVDQREIEMYHIHRPMLEEAGYIRWDGDAREVRKGPKFDEVRPLLELMADHRDELPDDVL